jgi:nitrite reductase/ring-hydroxylating ferredoxin subunit
MVSPDSQLVNRRSALVWTMRALGGAIAAIVGTIVSGAIASPGLARRRDAWTVAAWLDEIAEGEPLAATVRVARDDGYDESESRDVVYLQREPGGGVRALSSVCTHLGCRVAWDARARHFACPCHGGTYDAGGRVVAGPPPRPLARLETRIEDGRVLVRT